MATPWLPDTCLTSSRATEPMVQIIDRWAKDWFRKEPWRALGGWDDALGDDTAPFALLSRAGSMEIKGREGAKLALGLAITGNESSASRNQQDERFLRDLGTRAIEDLEARIAQEYPAPPAPQTGPAWTTFPRIFSLLVGAVGQAQIAIECSLAELVKMARGTYQAQTFSQPIEAPIDARDQTRVNVAAYLGTASISLRELAGLEAGDLLVLDSKPGECARLVIDDRPTDLKVSVKSQDDQFLLEFQEEQ